MHATLFTDLAIVLVVAAITGLVSRRLGQPSVLGYLLAGLIVGPYIPIPLFADPHRMEELAELGVILVMFAVGLEFRIRRLLTILPTSGVTAFVQIGTLALAGYSVGALMGWSTAACITLGSTLAISSTMVVSAVLDTHPVDEDVRSSVFGVLVVQDVVAIVLIALVTALAAGQALAATDLVGMIAQLTAFVLGLLVVGVLVIPRLVHRAVEQKGSEAVVVLAVGTAFGFALAAHALGYSVALGAFIAGIVVAESGRGTQVEHAVEPLRALFAALFFVSIGMAVDPRVALTTLPLAVVLGIVVIIGQLVSVTVASLLSGSSLRRSVYSGLALGQIGELSFILATIAVGGGVAPAELLPALVTVATVTAFTTPTLLQRADDIVTRVDQWLPPPLHRMLVAYQAFVRRIRTPGDGPSIARPAIAVVLDWVGLTVLLVVHHTLVSRYALRIVLDAAALILAAPLLYGLVRSGLKLWRAIRTLAREDDRTPRPVALAVETLAICASVLAVLIPTVAVLRPVMLGTWLQLGVGGSLVIGAAWVAHRLGRLDADYTSGVAQLALGVSRVIDSEDATSATEADALSGLDYVEVPIGTDAAAVGRSLADLNLRCRTGATVVAIQRGDSRILLPTGQQTLDEHDILAVSGSDDAIDRTRALFAFGVSEPTDPAPSPAPANPKTRPTDPGRSSLHPPG